MKRRFRFIAATLALLACTTGCGAQEGRDTPQSAPSQAATNVGEKDGGAAHDSASVPPWNGWSQEEVNEATQWRKEQGILDEHGQPAPGVDLNDYPGLG